MATKPKPAAADEPQTTIIGAPTSDYKPGKP